MTATLLRHRSLLLALSESGRVVARFGPFEWGRARTYLIQRGYEVVPSASYSGRAIIDRHNNSRLGLVLT